MIDETPDAPAPTRRRAVMLGAASAAAVVSIREIPGPNARRAVSYVVAGSSAVPAGTPGAVARPGRPFTGEDVRTTHAGGQLRGTNYIRRLQSGTSGFTCFASLQMSRG